MDTATPAPQQPQLSKTRFILGAVVFLAGQASPLLIPLVLASGLPNGWKTGLSGLLAFGIPELAIVAAAAVLGKAGFAYLKTRVFGWFKKHVHPPKTVSTTRYYIGLSMFLMPFLGGWLDPYVRPLLPTFDQHRIAWALTGDALLIASFFVLGGEFWDKLGALFVHKPNPKPATA